MLRASSSRFTLSPSLYSNRGESCSTRGLSALRTARGTCAAAATGAAAAGDAAVAEEGIVGGEGKAGEGGVEAPPVTAPVDDETGEAPPTTTPPRGPPGSRPVTAL